MADGEGGRKIMLIDSDDSYLRMLEGMLLQCNYCVTTCQKVAKAFSLLREKKSDYGMILSSANMPEVEGFKQVCIIRFKLQIPVILMSYDEPNFVLKGMIARGSCGYLKKPIHIDTLQNLWECEYLYSWYFKTIMIFQETDEYISNSSFTKGKPSDATVLKPMVFQVTDGCISKSLYPDGKPSDAEEENRHALAEIPVERKESLENNQVWSPELHQIFEKAVTELGIVNAKPHTILSRMNAQGLTVRQVRRHWVLYRKKLKRESRFLLAIVSDNCTNVISNGFAHCCLQGTKPSGGGKKVKRRAWSVELEQQFDKAVQELGGISHATARKIQDKMKVKDLTYYQVYHHLKTRRDD